MTPTWDGHRWRIQVRHDGRRFSFSSSIPGAKGRRECQKKYDAWYYGEATGEKTVERVCSEYLEDLKARRGEQSASYYQCSQYIRLYIAPKCASKKMCKMTLRDWQSVINGALSESGEPLSHKTLTNIRSIIMSVIKFGYADYQCELPRGELYIPQGHAKHEKEILQADDVRRLMEPSDLWYHSLFCFLAITGMRPGEALGLKSSDVYKDHVVIRRAVNSRNIVTDGKNENARRVIPIGALAHGLLEKTIARNESYKLHTEWIFCSPDGSKGIQKSAYKHWLKLKEDRNLPGTPYCLRHTFISLMKNVMPEQMIKDIVGHAVSFDTFGTYGHILDGEDRRAAQIIDLTFSENVPKASPKEK